MITRMKTKSHRISLSSYSLKLVILAIAIFVVSMLSEPSFSIGLTV